MSYKYITVFFVFSLFAHNPLWAANHSSIRAIYTGPSHPSYLSMQLTVYNTEENPCLTLETRFTDPTLAKESADKHEICEFESVEGKFSLKNQQSIDFYNFKWVGNSPTFIIEYLAAEPNTPMQFFSCGIKWQSDHSVIQCFRLDIELDQWKKASPIPMRSHTDAP